MILLLLLPLLPLQPPLPPLNSVNQWTLKTCWNNLTWQFEWWFSGFTPWHSGNKPLNGILYSLSFKISNTSVHINGVRAQGLRAKRYYADLETERERYLTTGKRAKRTKLDFRCPICRSAIGQAKTSLSDARQPEVRPSTFSYALTLTNLYCSVSVLL